MNNSQPKNSNSITELTPEIRELILEHLWKWLWRFIGLVVLIFGSISGFGLWASRTAIDAQITAFAKVGANDVADRLTNNKQFSETIASKTPSLPIGTVLIWHGNRTGIPTGWAFCDGSYPEQGWPKKSPDLSNQVLVGASADALFSNKPAIPLIIPEPERPLEAGGMAELNKGLGDGGRNVQFSTVDQGQPFYERVKTSIPKMSNHHIPIKVENLPRAEVYFIWRYK